MIHPFAFPEVATVQTVTNSQSASGEQIETYAAALEDIPAAVSAAVAEGRGPSMTLVTDEVNVLLRGAYPEVDTGSRVIVADVTYDVIAVAVHPARKHTWLRAKRTTPEGDR